MNSLNILDEEKISLDHDLMFVQVDKIHLIDWIDIRHIVLQNQIYKDQLEAKNNKKKDFRRI